VWERTEMRSAQESVVLLHAGELGRSRGRVRTLTGRVRGRGRTARRGEPAGRMGLTNHELDVAWVGALQLDTVG